MKLSDIDEDVIKKRFRHPCEARIDYKQALAALTCDLNSGNKLDDSWYVRDTQSIDTVTTLSMRDFLES